MASINDVFTELQAVNGTLGQIHADGIAEINATNQVKTSVDQVKASVDALDVDVKNGFNATLNALNVLTQLGVETVKLLFHQTQQADTMICALDQISKNTCAILTQVTIQTQLQTGIREDVEMLRYIAESTNPEAALEHKRLAELKAQVERCCPPDRPDPACKHEACQRPEPAKEPRLPDVRKEPRPIG